MTHSRLLQEGEVEENVGAVHCNAVQQYGGVPHNRTANTHHYPYNSHNESSAVVHSVRHAAAPSLTHNTRRRINKRPSNATTTTIEHSAVNQSYSAGTRSTLSINQHSSVAAYLTSPHLTSLTPHRPSPTRHAATASYLTAQLSSSTVDFPLVSFHAQ